MNENSYLSSLQLIIKMKDLFEGQLGFCVLESLIYHTKNQIDLEEQRLPEGDLRKKFLDHMKTNFVRFLDEKLDRY